MADGEVDILIVGAGPVGLALGVECARFGVRVRIVDRLAEPSEYSKALALWSSALEALAAMGCVDGIVASGTDVREMRVTAAGRALAAVDPARGVDSRFARPLLLPQSETERVLRERLSGLGVTVERSVEWLGFEETAEGVVSQLRGVDGREEVVRSRWLAGCDGAHSAVRHALGIGFAGEAMEEGFALCDAEIDQDLDPHTVILDWSPKGVLAVFPVRAGVWRLVANRRGDEWGDGAPTLAEMQAHLADHGRGEWKLSNPSWLSAFRVSERRAERFRVGRVLLVGDAAHIHSPAGGQGMNTGIQDAFNLGWKLGLLAAGRGDEDALLDSYNVERRAVADEVLDEAAARTKVSLLRNPAGRFVRDVAVRAAAQTKRFQEAFAGDLAGLGQIYAESPIIDEDSAWHEDWRSHGYVPGARVRGVEVYCPRRRCSVDLRDDLVGGGHAVILFSGRKPRARDAEALAAFEARAEELAGGVLTVVRVWRGSESPAGREWLLDGHGEAHTRFGVELPAAYVVRPDGFVAFRCTPLDAVVLADYAELVLGRRGELAAGS